MQEIYLHLKTMVAMPIRPKSRRENKWKEKRCLQKQFREFVCLVGFRFSQRSNVKVTALAVESEKDAIKEIFSSPISNFHFPYPDKLNNKTIYKTDRNIKFAVKTILLDPNHLDTHSLLFS